MNVRRIWGLWLLLPFAMSCTEAVPEGTFFGSLFSNPQLDGGVTSVTTNTPTGTINLPGVCDDTSTSIEKSSDGNTWTEVTAGIDFDCSDGTFNIPMTHDNAAGSDIFFGASVDTQYFYIRTITPNGETDPLVIPVTYDTSYAGPSITLGNLPLALSSNTSMNVTVSSADAVLYEYALTTTATSCAAATYGADFSIVSNIMESGMSDGNLRLCARGIDFAGVTSNPPEQHDFDVDTTPPASVTVTGAPTGLTNSTPLNVDISGVDVVDYAYKIGEDSVTDCTNPSGYGSAVSETINITDGLSVDQDYELCVVAADSVGNWMPFTSAESRVWTYDGSQPTVVLASSATDPVTGFFQVTATFSENVTGLAVGDFSSANSTITLSGSGASYTLDINPIADGVVTVGLPGGVAFDAAGNANIMASPATISRNMLAPVVEFQSASQTYNESSGDLTLDLIVELNNENAPAVSVNYSLGAGSATDTTDFTGTTTGTLSGFGVGDTLRTISINMLEDSFRDMATNETLIIDLTAPSGATLGTNSSHTITIVDDEPLPQVQFQLASDGTFENIASAQIIAELDIPSEVISSVDYATSDGTAADTVDYTAASGTLNFGAMSTLATISVGLIDVAGSDGDKDFNVSLSAPLTNLALGVQSSHTHTVRDDEAPQVYFQTSVSNSAENVGTHDIVLQMDSSQASDVIVSFTESGTATMGAPNDYTYTPNPLTIPTGSTLGTVVVTVNGSDGLGENAETVILDIDSVSGGAGVVEGAVGQHTYTIDPNDTPTINIAASAAVSETNTTFTHPVVISMSNAAEYDVIFTVNDGGGTATLTDDYTYGTGWGAATISAGSTDHTVNTDIVGDALGEGNQTFDIFFNGLSGATPGLTLHTVTINDDESNPVFSFNSASSNADESSGTANILVDMTPASDQSLTISYNVTGTADGGDFTDTTGSPITFAAGSTQETINLTITDDNNYEPGGETVVFTMTTAQTPATASGTTVHTYTIDDNDTNTVTWLGSISNSWSLAGNWSGGAIPTAGQTVIFDGSCTPNCDPVIDMAVTAGASPGAIDMQAGFSGSLNQSGFDIEVGSGGWTQAAGAFNGDAARQVQIGGDLTISGGSFTSGASLRIARNLSVSGGSLDMTTNSGQTTFYSIQNSNISSGLVFNNVIFNKGTDADITILGAINIGGNLTVFNNSGGTEEVNGGTINLSGDLSMQAGEGGTAAIQFLGSTDQTISVLGGTLPTGNLNINKSSGDIIQGSGVALGASQDIVFSQPAQWLMSGYNLSLDVLDGTSANGFVNSGCGTLSYNSISGTVGIMDDGVPNIDIIDPPNQSEGVALDFVVSMDSLHCAGNLTVNYNTADGIATTADVDYTAQSGTLTFFPGDSEYTISVATGPDVSVEGNEDLFVNISAASAGVITDANATGVILNDDATGNTWVGTAGDNNWSNASNWASNSVPAAGSDVYLAPQVCAGANCNVNLTAPSAARNFNILHGFTGTFSANGNNIDVNFDFNVYSGAVVHNSGSIINVYDGMYVDPAATFTSTGASLLRMSTGGTADFLDLNGNTVANLHIDKSSLGGSFNISSNLTVIGDLELTCPPTGTMQLNGTSIDLEGDLHLTGTSDGCGEGSAIVRLVGSAMQNVTGGSMVHGLPNVHINKSANTVFFNNRVVIYGDLIRNTGTIVFAGTNILEMAGATTSLMDGLNGYPLNDFLINKFGGNSVVLAEDTAVAGDFVLQGNSIQGNQILSVDGNVIINDGLHQEVDLIMTGAGTTISSTAGGNELPFNTVEFSPGPGNIISQASALSFNSTSDVILSDGVFRQDGFSFSSINDLFISSSNSAEWYRVCSPLFFNSISDDPPIQGDEVFINIDDPTVTEGVDMVFNVTLNQSNCMDTTFDFATADNTATATDDYTDLSTATTATITTGMTNIMITVPTNDDGMDEDPEDFALNLSNLMAGVKITDITGLGTILDNDAEPTLSISDESVSEGSVVQFVVSLSSPSGKDVSFDWITSDGTATTAGSDYTFSSGSGVTIPAGNSSITLPGIPTTADADSTEYFTATISAPNNATISDAIGQATIFGATAIDIFRSVGPGNSASLSFGAGNSLVITSGVATFASPLPDNIGVGDVIQYDSSNSGTIDSVVIISGRTDSNNYNVQMPDGSLPADLGIADQDWAIYRVYTSLSDAENGTANTSIDPTVRGLITGGNRDLVVNDEFWNLAMYADAEEINMAHFSGWVTSDRNRLKIYAPFEYSEVGRSQRHQGSMNDHGATIRVVNGHGLRMDLDYAEIEGIKFTGYSTVSHANGIFSSPIGTSGAIYITNNIISPENLNGSTAVGLDLSPTGTGYSYYLVNNLVVGIESQGCAALIAADFYIYNNSFLSCAGNVANEAFYISDGGGSASADFKNNIILNRINAAAIVPSGSPVLTGDSNVFSHNSGVLGGTNELVNTFPDLLDPEYGDFRVSHLDSNIIGNGADLSADANYAFDRDIRNFNRSVPWDIGAYQNVQPTNNHSDIVDLHIAVEMATGFSISAEVLGDSDSDASANIYYCDETSLPGCDPIIDGGAPVTTAYNSGSKNIDHEFTGLTTDHEYKLILEWYDPDNYDYIYYSIKAFTPNVNKISVVDTRFIPLSDTEIKVISYYIQDFNDTASMQLSFCDASADPFCSPTGSFGMTDMGTHYEYTLSGLTSLTDYSMEVQVNDGDIGPSFTIRGEETTLGTDYLRLYGPINITASTTTSFDLQIGFFEPGNTNGQANVFYCSRTNDSYCDPFEDGSMQSMSKDTPAAGQFSASVTGLAAIAGHDIAILVMGNDPEGVGNQGLYREMTLGAIDDISLSNHRIQNLSYDAFEVAVDYTGDDNGDANLRLWWCNQDNGAGCDPQAYNDAGNMTDFGTYYSINVSGLVAPDNPGDAINYRIVVTDPDGSTGNIDANFRLNDRIYINTVMPGTNINEGVVPSVQVMRETTFNSRVTTFEVDVFSNGATPTTDFLDIWAETNLPLQFDAFQTVMHVPAYVFQDDIVEPDETFWVRINDAAGSSGSVDNSNDYRQIQIMDDDLNVVTGVTDIAVGKAHACSIFGTEMRCWGFNNRYQLGNNTNVDNPLPSTPASQVTDYDRVYLGDEHSCGIKTDNSLYCWGYNLYGQVGTGGGTYETQPQLVDSGTGYSKVSLGLNSTCGITDAGALKCWGSQNNGRLGNGLTSGNQTTPVVVDSGVNYIDISVFSDHACGITNTNALKCWGRGLNGRLGDNNTIDQSLPVVIDSGTSYIQVAAGALHTCALTAANDVKCWGSDNNAQLGNGSGTIGDQIDAATVGVTMAGVSSIASGYSFSCAIDGGGDVYCWGAGSDGQLGVVGSYNFDFEDPTQVQGLNSVNKLSLGNITACALRAAGEPLCWGGNDKAVLGRQTATADTKPRDVDTSLVGAVNAYSFVDISFKKSGVSNNAYACGIIEDSGGNDSVYCWGENNFYDRLGVLETSYSGLGRPEFAVSGVSGTDVTKISVGYDHACVVSSGDIYCWGDGGYGKMGYGGGGSMTAQLVDETNVTGSGNFVGVSAGQDHTCAWTDDDGVYCWGRDNSGQVGEGAATSNVNIPVSVSGLPGGAVTDVQAGANHTCAIVNQQVYCWGSNSYGELGAGDTSIRDTANFVTGVGGNALMLAVGPRHSCAYSDDNNLYCWGDQTAGRLGNNTSAGNNPNSTSVYSAGNLTDIEAGSDHTCIKLNDDRVRCFGGHQNGQLGVSGFVDNDSATAGAMVEGVEAGIKELRLGIYLSCGLFQNGHVKCWGSDYYDSKGDSDETHIPSGIKAN